MERRVRQVTTLIISDVELNCKCEEITIDDLNISHVGLNVTILDKYDMIVYEGDKGTKVLKSKYTKTGKIG